MLNFNQSKFLMGVGGLMRNPRVKLIEGILRSDGNSSAAGTITWTLLDKTTNHGSTKYNKLTVSASSSNLRIRFPLAKYIHSFNVDIDETLQLRQVHCGSSVGTETIDISFSMANGVYSMRMTGNGTTGWNYAGDYSSFAFDQVSTSVFRLNPPKPFSGSDNVNLNLWNIYGCVAMYEGPNDYKLVRNPSPGGIYYIGWELIDNATGLGVTATATDDIITIQTACQKVLTLDPNTNNGFGFPGSPIFTSASNIQFMALVEY